MAYLRGLVPEFRSYRRGGITSKGASGDRIVLAVIFVAAAGVLVVAAWLSPDNSGMGTHQQLGLPACGFRLVTGFPCPTCGMTTAFSHAANGHLILAFTTQPAGSVLAVATAMTTVLCGFALITGMPLAPLGRWLARSSTVIVMGVLVVVGWAYSLWMYMRW